MPADRLDAPTPIQCLPDTGRSLGCGCVLGLVLDTLIVLVVVVVLAAL